MFVSKKRTKKNPNVYIQLVESYRNAEGKVRQRVIKHIGSAATDEQLEMVVSVAMQVKEKILAKCSSQDIDDFISTELSKIHGHRSLILNCEPVKVLNKGIVDVYGKVFTDMGLPEVVQSRTNYSEVLQDLVLGKIACFGSKRKMAEQLEHKFGKNHSLNSIYRAMDKIDDKAIELIQSKTSNYNKSLLGDQITLLFYDATTIYFESFDADELRKLGYSKDLKFNQPQIILTMLVTEGGLPLGYQVFPGNTYEGDTLRESLEAWQKLYPSQKFTVVADSGMLNELNLEYLEAQGFTYIVCAKMKNMSKVIKQEIISTKDRYQDDYYHEIKLGKRRLIVSYKHNRAIKDQYDRDRQIDKLKDKVKKNAKPSSLISNYGYKKYISINDKEKITLDDKKIEEAARWDGLHGIISNAENLSPEKLYSYYRGLSQIEDAFRINKSDLEVRPIFHWNAGRVKAHIAITYMAFCCYKAVEYSYNIKNAEPLSHRKIREALEETQVAIYQDRYSGTRFCMPLPIPAAAKAIYASQGLNLNLVAHTLPSQNS